ncbi:MULTISPECIES: excisionase family DNA-binding protein [Mycolicibacterium]|uniref:excisionase family DNA-binding protein n=1 Tax=Mycolicibacterium TaxID=1866885 RepID=UPI0007EAE6E0|nr:excisionase family DNA-binding protein [Mycolicibacterium fortuitum]OBG24085.1 hypothetical protein A5768_22190 [Mycolicibacterium fortuitum]
MITPTTPTDDDPDLTVHETAAEMHVHAETVRRMIRAKKLRAYVPGTNGYRVRKSWIDEYVRSTISVA